MKDWVGNNLSAYACNGASNHSNEIRQEDDYYATEPKALEMLLELETFKPAIWECACGGGHLSKVLEQHGHTVLSTDIIDRGYPGTEVINFLEADNKSGYDIVTNPPYKYAKEFVKHALDISPDGTKIAMFLKLTFLEGKSRRDLFSKYPPKTVYVSSSRLRCGKNGDFRTDESGANSAVAYGWYIWLKGYKGDTVVKWFN